MQAKQGLIVTETSCLYGKMSVTCTDFYPFDASSDPVQGPLIPLCMDKSC